MDLFISMEAFVRAAEAQSFANAARLIGVAEVGKSYYRDCAPLVNKVHRLCGRTSAGTHFLSGTPNVHVLPGFAPGHFSHALIAFREAYPRIEFVVTVNDRVIDPV